MKIFYITLLIMCAPLLVRGQNIVEKEQRLDSLKTEVAKREAHMDSLQPELSLLLDQIDAEKAQTNPDDVRLSELLSSALTLSDQIDHARGQVDRLQDSIALVSRSLNRLYADKIDSLDRAIAKTASESEREELERLQLHFTLRRMQVVPDLPELSFDPLVIETIRLDTMHNATGKQIYSDFLNRAYLELEHHYQQVTELEMNIRDMIRLEEKTIAFMEEIEDGTLMPLGRNIDGNNALSEYNRDNTFTEGTDMGGKNQQLAIQIPFRSIVILNHQLTGFSNAEVSPDDLESMSVEEQLQLLDQTKKSLKYYLEVTAEKLGGNPSDE